VERKEARRVKPWLSWTCRSGRWKELAGNRLGWRKISKSIKIQTGTQIVLVGTGQKMDLERKMPPR
jgi:hypothetical protein